MLMSQCSRQVTLSGASKPATCALPAHVACTQRSRQPRAVIVSALPAKEEVATGVAFEQVQAELVTVDKTNPATTSFARVNFTNDCESALNSQINIEYNISYVYHSLYQYFDRDNVGLPGIAQYFKEASDEERGHAELLMKYQNKRGGRVKLQTIVTPESEFNHDEKGDALYSFELALSLEKLNFMKLRDLHAVACVANDAAMTSFIEEQLLVEQVEAVKKVSEYVSQLRRIGKGLGVYIFDKQLSEEMEGAAA